MPFYRAWLSIRRLEVPTIAAVNGAAIGAGLCLALACDIRYAAAGAKLGLPFNKLGMHAGMAGTWLLPNVVGPAHARDLLLTGRVVEADEALRLGLVSRVVERDGFLDEVLGHGRRHRRHRADREPAHQDRARRRRPRRLRVRPAVGGARPADDAGDRRPAGGDRRRRARSGAPQFRRPLSRSASGRQKRPRSLRRLPSPADVEEPWGPSAAHARSRGRRRSTGRRPRLWTGLWRRCARGRSQRWSSGPRWGEACGRHARRGRRTVRVTSAYGATRGCGGEKVERPVGVRRGPGTGRHAAPDRLPHGAPARGEPPDRGLPQRRAHDPAAARRRGTPPRRGRHAHRAAPASARARPR